MTAAIEITDVVKEYAKLEERGMLLRSILPFAGPKRSVLRALDGVDLRVEQGETVGVLGRNGAGKSTMLRLLAGVTRPTSGTARIRGRVAPLLSVGVGFHPEMSGRENVYVNGMLLGLGTAEMDRRFDEIVAFAELEDFIDTPVKFYSSGMYMRLGFSVAIHVDPQVLLVDEVLAVGDIAFQLKCFERMRQLKREGTTILLVTHSMHAVRLLCPRAVLMRQGRIEFDGPAEDAIARHHELLSADDDAGGRAGAVDVLDRRVEDARSEEPVFHAVQGQQLRYRARIAFKEAVDSPQAWFQVVSEQGVLAYEMKTSIGSDYQLFEAGQDAEIDIPFVAQLGGGSYRIRVTLTDRDGRVPLNHPGEGVLVYLPPPLGTAGIADLAAQIDIGGHRLTDHDELLIDDRRRTANGRHRRRPPSGSAAKAEPTER